MTHPALLQGNKYSPNLANWWKRHATNRRMQVFDGKPFSEMDIRNKFIGSWDDDWFCGARLPVILRKGGKEITWAFAQAKTMDLQLIEGFWDAYAVDGRCAIDPDHSAYFIGNETRWHVEGDARHCLWCGKHTQTLIDVTRAVYRREWRVQS